MRALRMLIAIAAAVTVAACSGSADTTPSNDGEGSPPSSSPDADSGLAADGASASSGDAAIATGGDASSTPLDAGTSHDSGTPKGDASPPPATEFAPYFPTWTWGASGYAYKSLVDLKAKAGVKQVTIAFVLSGGGCNADDGIAQNLADVKAFVAAGGRVKASFGGADGAYVESKCANAADFAKAIEDFVDATGITDLDFDIEQDPVLTDAVNAMRGQALKLAQDTKHIEVAFTLAANPHSSSSSGGLTSQGLSVVKHAAMAGVAIKHVNLMTMDYGDSFGGKPLAPVAIGSLTDANAQLMSAIPGLTREQAWAIIGVIPMIGKNDDAEVFSIDDAKSVAAFATANKLGLVSFWSIDRDEPCGGGAQACSNVSQAAFDFAKIFAATAQ